MVAGLICVYVRACVRARACISRTRPSDTFLEDEFAMLVENVQRRQTIPGKCYLCSSEL
jgi:hypothetical protein